MDSRSEVLNFLKEQVETNAEKFPFPADKVLGFLGTASQPNTFTEIFPKKILKAEKNDNYSIDITFSGKLNKSFDAENNITVSIPDLSTFTGFQIKRGSLLANTSGNDTVKVKHVYTIHHTPNTTMKFEDIPHEEVISLTKKVDRALVGIGADANISPRFVVHFTEDGGTIKLYYASSVMNKSNANFIKNKSVSFFIPDLNTMNGYAFYGVGNNITEQDNREAYDKAVNLFEKGGWGKPRLVTEVTVEKIERVTV